MRCRSQGLRVTPHVAVSVNGHSVSSGTLVLPMITAPASRSRRTTSASARGGRLLGVGALGRHLAGDVDVVLDGDRHAQQRAPARRRGGGVGLVGLEQRPLGEHDAEGVQRPGRGARSAPGRARPARARRPRRRRSARPAGRFRRRRGRRLHRPPIYGNRAAPPPSRLRCGSRGPTRRERVVLSSHLRGRLRRAAQPADGVLPPDPRDPARDRAVRLRDRRRDRRR